MPLFVSVEGGEGAGKTVFSKRLVEKLRGSGREILHTREPGGTPLGEELRKILLSKDFVLDSDQELQLFLRARIEHLKEIIMPALISDAVVVCERFHDSTVVYQGFAPEGDLERIDIVEKICFQNMESPLLSGFIDYGFSCSRYSQNYFLPDLTFFLDLPEEEGLKRKAKQRSLDRMELKGLQFHHRVREGFKILASRSPDRIRMLDADRALDESVREAFDQICSEYSDFIYG